MLTPEQIAELRRKVEVLARRPQPGKTRGMVCIDGPLEGLVFRASAESYTNPKAILGMVQPTAAGLVAVNYIQSEQRGKLRFRGYERPAGRPS